MTAPSLRHPRGGPYFEAVAVSQVYRHGVTRTVTQQDYLQDYAMPMNPHPLQIDAHFCATEMRFGEPVINSLYTLRLMFGRRRTGTKPGRAYGRENETRTSPGPSTRARPVGLSMRPMRV